MAANDGTSFVENFEEWVEQGLEVSHGDSLDILSNDEDPLLPEAPVAFAFVTESDVVDAPAHVEVKMPALIPLPMNRFSVKANASPTSNDVRISYEASWSVCFVKAGHLCDILVVVPPPSTARSRGMLDNFKMEIPNCSKPGVRLCSTNAFTFDDVYFIQGSQVDGGAEVHASFQFSMPLFPSAKGVFSFKIPLKFPFYAKGFRVDKQLQPISCIQENELISKSRRCEIRIFLSVGVGQTIKKYAFDFPHWVISKSEDYKDLLHVSEGPGVEWPGRPLICGFICADKEARGGDCPIDEIVEPLVKTCLPTETS